MNKDISVYKKYIRIFWVVYASGVLAILLMFLMIAQGWLGFMPSFEDLENPENLLASEVVSADGVVLGKYFYKENRSFVSYEEFSPALRNALIATEDVRFFKHSGIDIRGLVRVVKGIMTADTNSGGGSTISQQLAKMLFPRDNLDNKLQLIFRKFKEWVIAIKLEKSYTKEEILTMYLNKYDFLNLAVGIKTAAKVYFNTTPDSLRLEQAAMLVGMAKNSSLYNPVRRPELTLSRRNVVLSQMEKYGYISKSEYESAKALPLSLDYQKVDFKTGPAPYFREYLRQAMNAKKPVKSDYRAWQLQKYREDSVEWQTNPLYGWCSKNKKSDGTSYNLYRDGIRIITTLDSRMQRYAEEALNYHLKNNLQPSFKKHLRSLKNKPFSNGLSTDAVEGILDQAIKQTERYRLAKLSGKSWEEIKRIFNHPVEMSVFSYKGERDTILSPLDSMKYYYSIFRSSFMSMEIKTGHVKAYVGGPDYTHFMYDMVKGGKRQVGSTVKPFLYTLAMQNGMAPCSKVPNVKQQFILPDGNIWEAKNSSPTKFDDKMVTLKWGLAHSVNQVSAWVMKQFNPQSVADIMKKMGVYSPIDPVPSMFLGTSDVTLYEMVGAYGTFANKGVFTQPIFVTRIEDRHGNIISTFRSEKHDAIDEQTAYLMIDLMRGVVDAGSGGRLRWSPEYGGFKGPIAAKTGTTQNHSDGWFIGVTPQLVNGSWTGAELRSIHFEDLQSGQGARMALPIWGYYMRKVYADRSLPYRDEIEFERPVNFTVNINCDDPESIEQSLDNSEDFF
ncbi:MAG: transglycosylase domain-containing protein [Bacteroidota bacterium]|nr:penicillin-binding protein [Odoribacter sp.]MDP3645411.1 transglycosylase domain-containing protein [Bacteroidota bacterium]